jgi:SAM-dependent methyltransferase
MREELELNRAHWDEATEIHGRANVYGIEDFKAGLCRLHRVEVEEVGDVSGKRLLHLQCHFGIDTLSWARRGARVTGADFSPQGIALAKRLAEETLLSAEFVCSDLYSLRDNFDAAAQFDIVYASYGVLNWLPDLDGWARVIAHYLKPGGFFYIVESHPAARIFPIDEDMPKAKTFRPFFSYFHDPAGIRWPATADYADASAVHQVATHEWQHTLSDIINSLLRAGLALEFVHEFPYCAWPVVAGSVEIERFSSSHGYFAPPDQPPLPLMFSLRARKP